MSYIHPLRLAGLELANNLCLAPMAGYTNLPFRLIVKRMGHCGLVATEMVAAMTPAQRRADRAFATAVAHRDEERPLAMQVYGREPELCAACAVELQQAGADLVDLNCGCPVRKAKQAGCGVALMREPERVGAILRAMRAVTTVPLGVKIRLGYDKNRRTGVAVARIAQDAGVDVITVHARTGESKHGAQLDFAGLAEVRAAVDVPVIANGDMHHEDNIRRARDEAGVDGYMIGRGAIGRPWIFAELSARFAGEPSATPDLERRSALLHEHFALVLELYGPERGIRIMRKYSLLYFHGQPGVRRFRDRFVRIATPEDFIRIVADYLAEARAHGAA
ncbi:MAG: tRNA dihydrouridine synthase [Planctomycetota bacterium]